MQDTLDFEDLFEIVTPSGVDRRILALDSAWSRLLSLAPDNSFLQSEFVAWRKWSENALDSFLSKFMASGTLTELDEWKARYNQAYSKVSGGTSIDAPSPFDLNKDFKVPAWLIPVAILGGIGLVVYLLSKAPSLSPRRSNYYFPSPKRLKRAS